MAEGDARDMTPPVEKVVVDVPGLAAVRPRIPDTQQRRTLEKRRSIREIVFGMQDGILTTLGIITGVGVAEGERAAVLSAVSSRCSPAGSRWASASTSAARRNVKSSQATIDLEKREMAEDPQGEFTEQVAFYKLKGFSADEAEMIVKRLTQHPEIYLYEMVRDEFGIDPREAEDPRSARAGGDERLVRARFAASDRRFLASVLDCRLDVGVAALRARRPVRRGLLRGHAERAQPGR